MTNGHLHSEESLGDRDRQAEMRRVLEKVLPSLSENGVVSTGGRTDEEADCQRYRHQRMSPPPAAMKSGQVSVNWRGVNRFGHVSKVDRCAALWDAPPGGTLPDFFVCSIRVVETAILPFCSGLNPLVSFNLGPLVHTYQKLFCI